MKKKFVPLFFMFPFVVLAQNSQYNLNSYLEQGTKAPNTHYLGEAWLNRVLQADENLSFNITKATFSANSTLDWHKHSESQVLVVVDGSGYYQEKGKNPIRLKVGDIIRAPANVEHWHAATKENDVTYLAIYSGETKWTQVLSREDYDRVANTLKVPK
ncbi:MAG: cupin domain-containing protein [Flavobacteriaceae bacterium]|jgi:quercetin dioxygenase-like cupin family protein|nr:cupin domain-containing protein [Flavobacteriaceae bacterium]